MNDLIESLDDFTWDNYKVISDALVDFDEHNVEQQMFKQASVYSYYYGLMCAAKRYMNQCSVDLTQFMSQLRKTLKREKPREGVKLTAKDLDDLVFSDPDYAKKQTFVDDSTFKYELLKGLVRALEQKKDMLQQVSANKREETKLYK